MTNSEYNKPALRFGEFVTLMALMTSLVALSIDTVLPALSEIGSDLGAQRDNDTQLIISLLFLGLSVGQLIYGPLSDSTGRKRAIYAGYGLFMTGCLLSISATSFSVMLAGRILQGVGIAGPRIVTMALIRDQYAGRAMARVMSFIMAIFILVPAIAPSFGQVLLIIAHWRAIFGAFLALAIITLTWFALRQPETLIPEQRHKFSLKRIGRAIREVILTRTSFGYTIAAGFVFSGFVGYLNSAQQVFQDQYGLGRLFPIYFSVLALAIGSASYSNTWLLKRYDMQQLTTTAALLVSGLSIIFFPAAYALGGSPPLWTMMLYFIIVFFCIGVLFGNLNALAMEPLGHIAGVGAAVVGSFSTLMSALLGTAIGQSYNGTILPLVAGFAILAAASLAAMRWAESGQQVSQAPTGG